MNNSKPSNLYLFSKDTQLRFTYCNDNLARAVGLDSPRQIIGKTDYELCWSESAKLCACDERLIMAEHHTHLNRIYKGLQHINERINILETKQPLYNRYNKCIGITGFYIDIGECQLINTSLSVNYKRISLEPFFPNEHLTSREVGVLKQILLGKTAVAIGQRLGISKRTVEGYINNIKQKLQCRSKGDIIETVVKLGLTYLL